MKFYSEHLKTLFDTEKDLKAAEAEYLTKEKEIDSIQEDILHHVDAIKKEFNTILDLSEKFDEIATDKQSELLIKKVMHSMADIFSGFFF
jgi:flagellar motility protein MotE (MotC chaperone)